jgi:phosphoribosylaminoimidazole-succinocarboxamide synthase
MNYDKNNALIQSEIPGVTLLNRGKVRDIYDLGDSLLFIASDRLSAFDVVMPNGIPRKGEVLTKLSLFWFELMDWMPNHLITADISSREELKPFVNDLQGRAMIVKKAQPLPVECIARGYIVGSGWKDYQREGKVSGIPLRAGYRQAEKLDEALFTPSTKAEQGLHDETISFERTVELIGQEKAEQIRDLTLKIYNTAADYARERGELNGEIILIDEVLTPDSSRFWPAEKYEVGCSPPSLDKQYVRDYLETLDWGKTAPGPTLPDEVVARTTEKYLEAYKKITGKDL